MKTFVIGISGVTNGGKTTLAKNLQKRLPNCSVISQDDFFKPESEIRTDENGFLQYDATAPHLSIGEAQQAAEHPPFLDLHTTPKQGDCLQKKKKGLTRIQNLIKMEFPVYFDSTRVYEPPDAPGYFDGHVWPMYLKHRQEMENISWEIIYLDGTKSEKDLFSQVYEDLIQELAKQKRLQVTA
nr:nicotinamide riboside kinase 1 [Vicugna pacos]